MDRPMMKILMISLLLNLSIGAAEGCNLSPQGGCVMVHPAKQKTFGPAAQKCFDHFISQVQAAARQHFAGTLTKDKETTLSNVIGTEFDECIKTQAKNANPFE